MNALPRSADLAKGRKGKVTDFNLVDIDSFVLFLHLLICRLHRIYRGHLHWSDWNSPHDVERCECLRYSLDSRSSWMLAPYSKSAVEAASIDLRTFSFASMYVVPVVGWQSTRVSSDPASRA